MNQRQVQKEWERMMRKEQTFVNRNLEKRTAGWQEKLDRYVPEKLENTLNRAFFAAFGLIFENGTGIIEKTYNREKKEQDYKIREFEAEVRDNKKSVRAFEKKAKSTRNVNSAVSVVEGVGMGVFGAGLPDIPLFLALLLKGIYEIALSYGFSYDTKREQFYILKLIETSLLHGEELVGGNVALNRMGEEIRMAAGGQQPGEEEFKEQMEKTSDALAKEMLYLKFVQGIPIVGIAGGISDVVYQRRITDYAALKYQRRFLEGKRGK